MTYGVASDIHCHKWSTFASTNGDGVNSRLRIILNELLRCAGAIKAAGGRTLVIPGDVFHVRGSVDPEVLNPVQDVFRQVLEMEIDIFMIPGNHDLAGKETTALGSAIQTLSQTLAQNGSITVVNEPKFIMTDQDENLAFVPWCSNVPDLLAKIEDLRNTLMQGLHKKTDLFIHAGIDGVLSSKLDHGLTPKILSAFGFRRVFAGHYHDHKNMGDGVYSIGATTHQTWSDVDTKAGFLLVDDTTVKFNASQAPNFVDVTGMSEGDMQLLADGNYVRFRGKAMKADAIKELRKFFTDYGALGVSIQVVKEAVSARSTATSKTGATLDESVLTYVDNVKDLPTNLDRDWIKKECADILDKSRAVLEEA